ncbi:MAG: DUF1697 domain-containing protein [Eudoraea sp.]|nr:DUF1697 domain-containing protein [Eudoraea sp.]
MPNYIALLRGINVSGQKKILMKDLKLLLENLGFTDVVTYIQSGNVVFKTESGSTASLEVLISEGIKKKFGYEVPVVVRTRDQIATIIRNNPYQDKELLEANKIGYVLFKQIPDRKLLQAFNEESYENEVFTIIDNCGYIVYHKGAGKAKLSNNLIERKLKINATSRNHRTMLKLWAISE